MDWGGLCVRGSLPTNDFFILAAASWLIDGQWTALNAWTWNWDDNVGFVASGNSYRYSRNILFGLNAQWYLGRSGRFNDTFSSGLSRGQRINELEFRFTYEI